MKIATEYGKDIIVGAGCGGVQVRDNMYLNSGVSSASVGGNQSYFALWSFNNSKYSNTPNKENEPMPLTVFSDPNNAAQGNPTGQLPSISTRRSIRNKKYVHTLDRIQAEAHVFDTSTNKGSFAWSLRTDNVCKSFAVKDESNLPLNDSSVDL